MRLLKSSSNYLRKKAARNLVKGILCLIILLVLLITSIDVTPLYIDAGRYTTSRGIAMGLFIVGCYYFLLLQYWSYRRGIIGEQKVVRLLSAALSDEYSIFNNVTLKGMWGDIDHVVVGPTGIFVIETKNIKGRISYYGDNWEGVRRGSPSRQARINAIRIKKIVASAPSLASRSFWIQGLVVLADNGAKVIERKPPEHVKVTRIDGLADFINSEPRRIETQEIKLIEAEIKSRVQLE